MGTSRDYLHLGKENLFDVVAIGLNDEGKWAIFIASGACTFTSDPPALQRPYRSRQDAERELERILKKFDQGCHPDYWSPSLRLEVWTLKEFDEAWDSGNYDSFFK
jgi:hypothetical protein